MKRANGSDVRRGKGVESLQKKGSRTLNGSSLELSGGADYLGSVLEVQHKIDEWRSN